MPEFRDVPHAIGPLKLFLLLKSTVPEACHTREASAAAKLYSSSRGPLYTAGRKPGRHKKEHSKQTKITVDKKLEECNVPVGKRLPGQRRRGAGRKKRGTEAFP